jgi:phosphatidate cytidylyltransferase
MKKTIVGIGLASFAVALMYIGPMAMSVWLLVATFFGLKEYYEMHRKKGVRALPWLGIPVGCSFIILALLQVYKEGKIFGPQNFALVVTVLVLGALVYQFSFAAKGMRQISTSEVSVTLFGSVYVGGLLSYILLIWDLGVKYFPDDPVKTNLCVLLPFWAAYGSDSAAFLIGSKFGRHKMFPRVSPNKSVEGSIAAMIACVIGTVIIGRFLGYPIASLIGIGILAGAAAQIGDYCESVFKREHEVKDSGGAFGSTHGGFLDKMDSIVFALPVIFYFLYWFRPPASIGQ